MEKEEKRFFAYTDGSCDHSNPQRPGGSAYIILDNNGNIYKKASKRFMHTTNNRMEMLAIISVINSLPVNSDVIIYTDSQYCILALKSDKPKKNIDLVNKYHTLKEKLSSVELEWVKGHNGNYYNELCDKMANEECFQTV